MEVYLTTVRPVLEYAVPVWQAIPGFLSDIIESVQKRALKIIYPAAETYSEALHLANLSTLSDRRDHLCSKYMDRMKQDDHPLSHLLPKLVASSCNYHLRTAPREFYLFKNVISCRTKRTEDFFTFKYFK